MHDPWKDMFVLGLPLVEKILCPSIASLVSALEIR